MYPIDFAAATHPGRRPNNEDAFCTAPELGLFAVADGLGGYEGGEIASTLAVRTLEAFLRAQRRDAEGTWPCAMQRRLSHDENLVRAGVLLAHREICARRHEQLSMMGSTLAAMVLTGGDVVVAHVGDSRVYRLRGDELCQLTRDHSVHAELVAAGAEVPPREQFAYRHHITRALGLERAVPDVSTQRAEPGDVFLLCSDGLYEPLPLDRLSGLLAERSARRACDALVAEAYGRGGTDNITAVVVRVGLPAGGS